MEINGQHIDDARFKLVVDILVGRTSVGVRAADARRAAQAAAKRAFQEIMEWDAKQGVR